MTKEVTERKAGIEGVRKCASQEADARRKLRGVKWSLRCLNDYPIRFGS